MLEIPVPVDPTSALGRLQYGHLRGGTEQKEGYRRGVSVQGRVSGFGIWRTEMCLSAGVLITHDYMTVHIHVAESQREGKKERTKERERQRLEIGIDEVDSKLD